MENQWVGDMASLLLFIEKNLNRKYFNCNTQVISWIGDNKEVMGAQKNRSAEFR